MAILKYLTELKNNTYGDVVALAEQGLVLDSDTMDVAIETIAQATGVRLADAKVQNFCVDSS